MKQRLEQQSVDSVEALLSKRRKKSSSSTEAVEAPTGRSSSSTLEPFQPGSVDAADFVSSLRAEFAAPPAASAAAPAVSTAAWLRYSTAEMGGEGAEEYDDNGDDDDDDDEWDEPIGNGAYDQVWDEAADGSSSAPPPLAFDRSMGADVDLLIDAPAGGGAEGEDDATHYRSASAAASRAADEAEALSTEQQAELRKLKRAHNAQRKRRSEALHRANLLCWLSHGRLLSDQADDAMLQSRLLSLAPPELIDLGVRGNGVDGASALVRIATWLHAYLKAPTAGSGQLPGATAAAGRGGGKGRGRGGGGGGGGGGRAAGASNSSAASSLAGVASHGDAGLRRCEEAWMLVRLAQLSSSSNAPAWAPPAMGRAAASRLMRPGPGAVGAAAGEDEGALALVVPEAGAAPFYRPPAPRHAASFVALKALASKLLTAGASAGAAEPTPMPALAAALESRDGTSAQRTLLLLSLYRCLGLRSRLVLVLQPPPLKPPPEGKAHPTPSEPPPLWPHVPMWLEVYVEAMQRWVSLDATEYGRPVLDKPEETLVARAPVKGAQSKAAAARAYIVAYSEGDVRDVTPRYASNVAACHATRTASAWWEAALRAVPFARQHHGTSTERASSSAAPSSSAASSAAASSAVACSSFASASTSTSASASTPASAFASTAAACSPPASASIPPHGSRKHRASGGGKPAPPPVGAQIVDVDAEDAEDAELRLRESSAPLPTSLADYKKHPVYILQRDIKTTQAIFPSSTKPVGLCKGQRVYPRACVRDLRSEQAWFRRGYDVKPSEVPVKELAPKAAAGKKATARAAAAAEGEVSLDALDTDGGGGLGGGSSGGGGGGTLLFGEWQTMQHVPAMASNGKVPRSAHGHVEMWTARHLPIGCVHIRNAPKIGHAAKQLGLDASPAMVGFDIRDGRPVPSFDGFVVCAEHADLLREAAAAMSEHAEDGMVHKQREEALGLWRTLLRAMAVRKRLEKEYARSE